MTQPVVLVLGAGPGIGTAVARRFAAAGFTPVLASRSGRPVDGLDAETIALDLTDPAAVTNAVTQVGERHGRIDVLHLNPSAFRHASPLELTVDQLFDDLALGVAPLLPAVQAALPWLHEGARVLVTGSAAADKPWNEAASLGVQKAALRNLVISLDTTLAPRGVRAVSLQVNGVLADEGTFSPEPIAEAMLAAVRRDDDEWTPRVDYP